MKKTKQILSMILLIGLVVSTMPTQILAASKSVSQFQKEVLSSWVKPVTASFLSVTGGRAFGSSRSNGRRHAGIDYYVRNGHGTPVYAMQSGTVIEYSGNFYAGTQAIAVKHRDGSVARYCEISTSLRKNSKVTQGQQIGIIKANNNEGGTMLHLELYLGTASGSLSNSSNKTYDYVSAKKYNRRRDLIDPSFLLNLTAVKKSSTASNSSATTSKTTSSKSKVYSEILFDPWYYSTKYADLNAAFGYDATALKKHWNTYGKKEGRSPSQYYDPSYYLANNSDVKNAFGNDYTSVYNHWITYGIAEMRKSSPLYDGSYYKNKYGDLQNAFGNDGTAYLNHFHTHGKREGRQANADFNLDVYKQYGDLINAFGNSNTDYYRHYMIWGIREGRHCK